MHKTVLWVIATFFFAAAAAGCFRHGCYIVGAAAAIATFFSVFFAVTLIGRKLEVR